MAGNQPRPTMSFTELVAKRNTDALKPFIQQQVDQLGMKLSRAQLGSLAPVLLRLSALEELAREKLGETEESIAYRVVSLEDKSLGLEMVDGPAEAGDTVRYSIQVNSQGETFKQTTRKLAQRAVSPEDMQVQEAMIGLKAGESKVIDIASTKNSYKLTVERVSRAPKPPEAPAPAEPEAPAAEATAPATEAAAAPQTESQPEQTDATTSTDA